MPNDELVTESYAFVFDGRVFEVWGAGGNQRFHVGLTQPVELEHKRVMGVTLKLSLRIGGGGITFTRMDLTDAEYASLEALVGQVNAAITAAGA